MKQEFKPEYRFSTEFKKQISDEIKQVENNPKIKTVKKDRIIKEFLTNLLVWGI